MAKRHAVRYLAFLLAVLPLCAAAGGGVVINEFMASTCIITKGQDYDWVELFNPGAQEADLTGWFLSDDPGDPRAWPFPSGTRIPAQGYLLVYCAGEEDTSGRAGLYTDFKLSAGGEDVCLTDPDGNTESVPYGEQYGNISTGVPLGGRGWAYLEVPTPGRENPQSGYPWRAQAPTLSPEAGFYDGPVSVRILSDEGAEIRYTLDGSEPTRASELYQGPVTLDETAVVRARCFGEDMLGSVAVGGTYLVSDPSPVPVVSVYTDPELLYGSAKGLLVYGTGAAPNWEQEWEYIAGIEYFDGDGVRRLAGQATIRVAGNTSRDEKQKSLALFARAALDMETFNYAFFDEREYGSYSSLLLRSGGSDARFCRLRDEVFSQMSAGLGLYYQAARPVLAYINGEYAGHYNLRERPNRDSLAQWEGITDSKLIAHADILESTGMDSADVIQGSAQDWVSLMRFCRQSDLNDPVNLRRVLDEMDVDSLFNYAVFNMVIGNTDANNVRVYRFPGGKWKFLLHDVEASCANESEAPVGSMLRDKNSSAALYPHWPLAALLEVPKYRDLFLKRTAEIVQSHFLYDLHAAPVFERWEAALEPLIPRHLTVYKALTKDEWVSNVRSAMFFARIRPKHVLGYIGDRLGLTNTEREAYFGETLALLAVHNAPK